MLDRYAVINHKLFRGAVRMTPDAFQALTYRLSTTNAFRSISSFWRVQQQVAVGLYQLGWSGNGGGVHDVAFACGCSQGSVHKWTDRTIAGLYKLNSEVVTFATEDKRAKAKAWVADKSGVEEWSRGWLVVDGTHINLAWKPALNACEHYSYKVWASGSGIVAKPCLHLDEGEFVWVDAGYGYSSYTVGPYSNTVSEVTRLKPVICSRTASITDLVEICDCICSIAILVKLCRSDVPMALLAQICDWSNAIADFD
ncbi:uncharacterized protein UDID_18591 [Ustilago sp. UG-2017a]|nr:uncharacterized protein UDID_18591 [Ustilago sp. UG-2017a]